MKKLGYSLFLICFTGIFFSQSSYAQSYIEDQTGKVNQETKDYVSTLNKEKFSILEGEPEYGVVITQDVEPEGNRIDLHIENKFRNFDFKIREAPVNIVVVFVLAQNEISFAHGEKLTSIFDPLNKDLELKARLLDLVKSGNYNEAIIEVSDIVYQQVEQAYLGKGLATISKESDKLRDEYVKQQEYSKIRYLLLFTSILVIVFLVYNFYYRYKNSRVKKDFYMHGILPDKLLKDALFDQKDLDHWLQNNRKFYHDYTNKNEAIRALKYYCLYNYFPKKINQYRAITDQQKSLLKKSLMNRKIGDYFFANYFSDEEYTFLMFNTMIVDAQKVSEAYTENLLSSLSKVISEKSIEDEILESKWLLLPQYKLSMYEEAKSVIEAKHENGDYLAENMIANLSYEQLLDGLSDELEKVCSNSFKTAIFKVDLGEVYKLEPIYKEIIENDFSDEDLSEVMSSIRIGYRADLTSIPKLKEVVRATIINIQETIRDRKKHQTTVVRFDFVEREVKTILRPKSKNRF